MEDVKIKLAVLWIFYAVILSAYVVLMFIVPGVIEEIMSLEWTQTYSEGLLLVFALFWLIPLSMAFLSLTLKDSANRWANIIVGIAWAAIGIFFTIVGYEYISIAHHLIDASMYVVLVLIVWYAWKWPKKEG